MSDVPVFDTFEQFWPYYVKEHAKPLTRLLHFIGTTIAVPMGLVAFRHPRRAAYLIPAALVAGYGPAWFSHFFIEKNRPATFTYPRWSLMADMKMWALTASGKMDAEVARVLADYAAKESAARAAEHATPARSSHGERRIDPMAN